MEIHKEAHRAGINTTLLLLLRLQKNKDNTLPVVNVVTSGWNTITSVYLDGPQDGTIDHFAVHLSQGILHEFTVNDVERIELRDRLTIRLKENE